MDKPKMIIMKPVKRAARGPVVVVPHTVSDASTSSKQTSNKLTFQNGFYTLKPDSSNLNVQKALTPNGKITVVATTISAPQKQQTPPVSISNAAPTARQDLHNVQVELRRCLHTYQMLKHKDKIVNSSSCFNSSDISQTKLDLKSLERRITELTAEQNALVAQARDKLVSENKHKIRPVISNNNRGAMRQPSKIVPLGQGRNIYSHTAKTPKYKNAPNSIISQSSTVMIPAMIQVVGSKATPTRTVLSAPTRLSPRVVPLTPQLTKDKILTESVSPNKPGTSSTFIPTTASEHNEPVEVASASVPLPSATSNTSTDESSKSQIASEDIKDINTNFTPKPTHTSLTPMNSSPQNSRSPIDLTVSKGSNVTTGSPTRMSLTPIDLTVSKDPTVTAGETSKLEPCLESEKQVQPEKAVNSESEKTTQKHKLEIVELDESPTKAKVPKLMLEKVGSTKEASDSADDIEVVENISPTRMCKPHLLQKPVSTSPVPPPINESDAQYSSVQETHLKAIKNTGVTEADDPEEQRSIAFMAALDLVTPQTLTMLQRRRSERKRRVRTRYEDKVNTHMKKGNAYLESLRFKSLAANRPRRSTRTASPPPPPKPVAKKVAKPAVQSSKPPKPVTPEPIQISSGNESGHEDYCAVCSQSGRLLLCDSCTLVYHLECVKLRTVPSGVWNCPKCVKSTKLVNVNIRNSSAINAVHSYVRAKAHKDDEQGKLLKRNTELVEITKSLRDKVEGLNKTVQHRLQDKNDLQENTQSSRKSLRKLIEILRSLKKVAASKK